MTDQELNNLATDIAEYVANEYVQDVCLGRSLPYYDQSNESQDISDDAHEIWQNMFNDVYNKVVEHGTQYQSE